MTDESGSPAERLADLVDEFGSKAEHLAPAYKEDWVRSDFIEPMLDLLGWAHLRQAGLTNKSTGFIREVPLKSTSQALAPDYALYVDGRRRLFIEAKKPFVKIETDESPAFQIRHYGWNAGDSIGILTDFEEFAIYNCRLPPAVGDPATEGRIDYFGYREFNKRLPWLLEHLTPGAVREGSLESLADEFKTARRLIPVGPAFLAEVQGWRRDIAVDIAANNPRLGGRDLNASVQAILDRIIFLRIAEARGLEADGTLAATISGEAVYAQLLDLFRHADQRYNSGLFHFRKERGRGDPDEVTPALTVADGPLRSMIGRLTSAGSPYRFSILPADILGQVYEQMLGQVLVRVDGEIRLEPKPEVRKAKGVFYTPVFVVEHIVQATLGPVLKDLSVARAAEVRIVDPSCGSGSFLIVAYQYLLDWHLDRYVRSERQNKRFLERGSDGNWRLRLEERKRILVNSIYGVDIDPQAVEVAKLSLLLKVIEGETQMAFAVERLLPDLEQNVVCGNSLVGSDFFGTEELVNLTPDEAERVNAFDWAAAFPQVAPAEGFDAVIGNPPWLMAGYYVADSMEYFGRTYQVATGKFDLYYLFLEKSCRLVNSSGRVGMIVPSKFFHTKAAKALRGKLADESWIESIVDFGLTKVFDGATNYSAILQLRQGSQGPIEITAADYDFRNATASAIPRQQLGADTWHLISEESRKVWARLQDESDSLDSITRRFGTGAQTGADPIMLLKDVVARRNRIESAVLKPTLRGKHVRRYRTREPDMMVFPYKASADDDEFVLLEEASISKYSGAWAYLKANREHLDDRVWFGRSAAELSGAWYGIPYLDHRWAFESPHLLTPSLSDRSNFAMGTGDLFVTGTAGVTSVIPKADIPESIWYLLAVLNSTLISRYITDHSTPYQGGYFKFSRPYLTNAPIHRIDFADKREALAHKDLVALAQKASELWGEFDSLSANGRAIARRSIATVEARIDDAVFWLYGVTDDERRAIGL